ncbi:MAG: hypothetical protein IJA34_16325 [Lachnospiraceae bacterium]|nr:hypothetical protein [Lachnospiraceae bacterium]
MNKILKMLLFGVIVISFFVFDKDYSVYANEKLGIDMEDVKRQVVNIIENERPGSFSSMKEYDIEELCVIERMEYMINDYIESRDFNSLYYSYKDYNECKLILPFINKENAYGYSIFRLENGVVRWIQSSVSSTQNYYMRLVEGRFEGVDVENVEEVRYFYNEIYNIYMSYIKMKDGSEHIMTFLSENQSNFCSLENAKIYEIDEFFELMYRDYDEPTYEEFKANEEKYKGQYGGNPFKREEPLKGEINLFGDKKETDTKKDNFNIIVISVIVGMLVLIIGSLYFRGKNRKSEN